MNAALRGTALAGLLAVLALGPLGCVSLSYERTLEGEDRFMAEAKRLEPGGSTLRDALEKLGPPDLILRVGYVDRAYYVSWDSDYFKVVFGVKIPTTVRDISWDLMILSLGGETLRLARLEFDRGGILRDVQSTTFEAAQRGQYVSIDDRIVSNFLEDRLRALLVAEEDDDEEDVELDAPAGVKEGEGRE